MKNSDIKQIERLLTKYASDVGDNIDKGLPNRVPYNIIADLVTNYEDEATEVCRNKNYLANVEYFIEQCRLMRAQHIPLDWFNADEFFNVDDTDAFAYRLNLMYILANDFYSYFDKKLNNRQVANDILFNKDGRYRPIGYHTYKQGSVWDQVEQYQKSHSNDDEDLIDTFIELLSTNGFKTLKSKLNLTNSDLARWVIETVANDDVKKVSDLLDGNGQPVSGLSSASINVFKKLRGLYSQLDDDEQDDLIKELHYIYG